MLITGLLIFIGLMALGVPIWLTMAVSGTFLTIFLQGLPPTTIPLLLFSSLDSFVLLAVPFFLLGGNIMAYCGPSRYIFTAIENYVGHIPGGLPFATVVSCMVYAAITGSTTATIVAIGTIAIPPMIKAGYPKSFCTGLMANSATIGQLIPPSVYMILYGAMVQEDVGLLFLSGVIPGLIIGFAMAFLSAYIAVKKNFSLPPPASPEVRRKALIKGSPAILMPVIVLGGIYSGVFTPTEAAGVSCAYSFAIAAFFYRELTWENFKMAVSASVAATSMIFMIVASVILYAGPLTFAGIPQAITNTIVGYGVGQTTVLILIVCIWLVFGMFLDPLPIMYLTIPVVLPVLKHFGINLIHFNVLCIICMQIAQVTPPFGISLFTVSGVFQETVPNVIRGAWPYLLLMILSLPLFILVPWLSTFLPSLIRP
ncbi:MAG: TRAP transporter large permease [Syntrophaceae bacterium]|nr:TRAP transporter large permease [Syntrophaceae bacterium]